MSMHRIVRRAVTAPFGFALPRRFPVPVRFAIPLRFVVLLGVAVACGRSLRPIDASSRVGDRVVPGSELVLPQPCKILPGGAPMGRPDGVRSHRLLPGRFAPEFEDDGGVYFASPNGVLITEPGLKGSRTVPGGIYVPRDRSIDGSEYTGDAGGIGTRQRLPGHCRFSIEAAAPREAGSGG